MWAYRKTPHESTGEKPSFLLYGQDCHTPTEAALFPANRIEPVEVGDYRQQMIVSLSEARELAVKNIRQAQKRYKKYYDRHATPSRIEAGDWVFVHFPQQEMGEIRKRYRPWFGPYRVRSISDTDWRTHPDPPSTGCTLPPSLASRILLVQAKV